MRGRHRVGVDVAAVGTAEHQVDLAGARRRARAQRRLDEAVGVGVVDEQVVIDVVDDIARAVVVEGAHAPPEPFGIVRMEPQFLRVELAGHGNEVLMDIAGNGIAQILVAVGQHAAVLVRADE